MNHMLMLQLPLMQSLTEVSAYIDRHVSPWLTYASEEGELPLFRQLLLYPGPTPDRRFIDGLRCGLRPATLKEWTLWSDMLCGLGKALAHLNSNKRGMDGEVLTYWVMLPYPFSQQGQDRLNRLMAWTLEFLEQWVQYSSGSGANQQLAGFVWGRECILGRDVELVQAYNRWLSSLAYPVLWLPNYGSYHVGEWAQLGFRFTALFSNYTGQGPYDQTWLDNSTIYAAANSLGWQSVYGYGPRFSAAHPHAYLQATENYMQLSGTGPIVHRLVRLTKEDVEHHYPYLYPRLYEMIHDGGDSQ